MTNLRRIQNNGIDIVVDMDSEFGRVFVSIPTVARVTGVSIEEVEEVVRGVEEEPTIDVNCVFHRASIELDALHDSPFSPILEAQGFINERKIAVVIQKYSPDLFLMLIQASGIRGFFCELAGLEIRI